jgi:hypothetical protein
VHLVALDVTLDGRRYGERFDMVVGIRSNAARHSERPRRAEPDVGGQKGKSAAPLVAQRGEKVEVVELVP